MKTTSAWIPAGEASALLGVSRTTLYAYVSRGYVRSQSMPGPSRERGYARDDIERLRRRREERRAPDKAAARALQWGLPVLESSITLVDGRTLYYRGHDVLALARSRTVEEVAALIWTGRFEVAPSAEPWSVPRSAPALPFPARTQTMLALASARDSQAFDTRPAAVIRTAWRILRLMADAAVGPVARDVPLGRRLARAWTGADRAHDVLRGALILCADHELNVSSFTARCVASAGSAPYAVVSAALAALEGPRHGGAGVRVEAMLASLRRSPVRSALAERLRRGDSIEGFGHPLYPEGDPRATLLLDWLRQRYGRSAELRFVMDLAEQAGTATGERPNLDFALAALSRVLRLPPGAPLMIFAVGRTIGWLGHAIEQYATGQLIRPRAKYVGVVPGDNS